MLLLYLVTAFPSQRSCTFCKAKHLITFVSPLVSLQMCLLRAEWKEEKHSVVCRRVCFDYELIGNVGLVSDLFWVSGAQSSVVLLL